MHQRQLLTKSIRRTFSLLFSRPIVAGDSQYCCCSRRWEAVGKKTTEIGNRGANFLAFISIRASPSLFCLSFTSSNEQKFSCSFFLLFRFLIAFLLLLSGSFSPSISVDRNISDFVSLFFAGKWFCGNEFVQLEKCLIATYGSEWHW